MISQRNKLLYSALLLCLPSFVVAEITTLQSWDPMPMFNATNLNTPPDTQFCTIIKNKMIKDEQLITQTDSLINTLTRNISNNNKSSNLVYNNEDNQFNQLFEFKNKLINEIAFKKIEIINLQLFIKDISTVINIKNTKGTNGKMKLILPFLFIFLFIFISIFISFYRKQSSKLNNI